MRTVGSVIRGPTVPRVAHSAPGAMAVTSIEGMRSIGAALVEPQAATRRSRRFIGRSPRRSQPYRRSAGEQHVVLRCRTFAGVELELDHLAAHLLVAARMLERDLGRQHVDDGADLAADHHRGATTVKPGALAGVV